MEYQRPQLLAHQRPPQGFIDGEKKGWLMLAGRGAGKTHGGAAEVHRRLSTKPQKIRIITPTSGDAVNAPVDAIQEIAGEDVTWRPTAPGGARLIWPNGSVAMVIGTPTPRDVERLRAAGNVTGDWIDEAAANPQLEAAWKQTLFSRRIGETWWIATTTPKPLRRLKMWLNSDTVDVTRATMRDNPYLAGDVLDEILADIPEGSREWREEVLGELVEDFEGALWTAGGLDETRVPEAPTLQRIRVGVDPATSGGTTGIIVCGVADQHLYVLQDHSSSGPPEVWAKVVADVADAWGCMIVAEANQGGQMVKAVLDSAGVSTPVKLVRAVEGKRARAEPVSMLWQAGRGHIVGSLPMLEDELTSFVPGESESPDRLDAMVWAAADLGVTRKKATYRSPTSWASRVA